MDRRPWNVILALVSRPKLRLAGAAVTMLVLASGAAASVWTPASTVGGSLNSGLGLSGVLGIDDAPNGDLWVTEANSGWVTRIGSDGTFVAQIGGFVVPTGVAVGLDGTLFVLDQGNGYVQHFSDDGSLISTFGSGSFGRGGPRGVAVAEDGTVYVADPASGLVTMWTSSGVFLDTLPNACPGPSPRPIPWGVGVDPDGNVWIGCVVDENTQDVVRKVSPDGTVLLTLTGFGQPFDLGFDDNGQVHIVNSSTNEVRTYTLGGSYVETLSVPGPPVYALEVAASGKLYVPPITGAIWVFDPATSPLADVDGDGIPDDLDSDGGAGTGPAGFSDLSTAVPTTGTVSSGSVTVVDAADPSKGVVVTAGPTGAVLSPVCGSSFEVEIPAGGSLTITCHSIEITNVSGGP